MEKQLLASTDSGMDKPRRTPQTYTGTAIFILIALCAFVTSVAVAGFFIGRVSSRCAERDSTSRVTTDEAQQMIDTWTRVIGRHGDRSHTVGMAIDDPQPGTCLCTIEDDVPLLQDPEPYSDRLVLTEKGTCFRYLQTFHWQTRSLVYYRLTNKDLNVVGWISNNLLQTSGNCSTSPIDAEKVEQTQGFARGPVSAHCLLCICDLESMCRPIGCKMDVGSLSCGYFQIKMGYWKDCGMPGTDLKSCADDVYCSSLCVQNYMRRYVQETGCPYTCETYAREHNGGPNGCKSRSTIGYWNRLIKQPGCKNPSITEL